MKKKLNYEKLTTFIIIAIGIILIALISFRVYNDFFNKSSDEKKEIDSIELFGYKLHDEDIDIYKDEFDVLSDILSQKEINYNSYAESITKMFIMDFYTLKNKKASTNIGGLMFVHPDILENFKINAGDTIYKYVESNVDGKRTQKLPEVKIVTVDEVKEIKFTYNKKEYPAYEVKTVWEYIEDLDYPTSGVFTLIKDGNKLSLVKGE